MIVKVEPGTTEPDRKKRRLKQPAAYRDNPDQAQEQQQQQELEGQQEQQHVQESSPRKGRRTRKDGNKQRSSQHQEALSSEQQAAALLGEGVAIGTANQDMQAAEQRRLASAGEGAAAASVQGAAAAVAAAAAGVGSTPGASKEAVHPAASPASLPASHADRRLMQQLQLAVKAAPSAAASEQPARVQVCSNLHELLGLGAQIELVGLNTQSVTVKRPDANHGIHPKIDARWLENGRRWVVTVVRGLGQGSYGKVLLVRAVLAQGHHLQYSSSLMVNQAESNSSSSSSSSGSEGRGLPEPSLLLALKLGRPLRVGAGPLELRLDTLQKTSFSNEAAVLMKAAEGEEDGGAINCYDFGEVVLRTQGVGKGEIVGVVPCLLLEYAEAGSLEDWVKVEYPFGMSSEDARVIMRRIVAMLANFHRNSKAVHRDIKPANILLSGDPKDPLNKLRPRIGDAGTARMLKGAWDFAYTAEQGTPAFRAPEGESGTAGVDMKFDTWGLACTLIQIRFGGIPFKYLHDLRDAGVIDDAEFQRRWQNRAAELDDPRTDYGAAGALTPEEKAWLQKCLSTNPAERPVASRLACSEEYSADPEVDERLEALLAQHGTAQPN